MIRHFYSKGIAIYGFEGKSLQSGTILDSTQANTFFTLVKRHLASLEQLKIGRKLVEAMNASGKVCTIFKAGPDPNKSNSALDSVTTTNPPGAAAEIACSVKHFAPRHHIMPLNSRGNPSSAADNLVVKNMMSMTPKQILNKPTGVVTYDNKTALAQGYKAELQQAGGATSKSALASELTTVISRTPFWMTRGYIAKKAGISENDLKKMERGEMGINQETYYRIAILLYDYLTPGSGTDTQVRFRAVDFESLNPGTYNPKANSDDAPGMIVLGHELIHAWRMMLGRRLVRQGWEEEAMTTGLYKFAELEFTENKLRAEANLPMRAKYQKGFCSSQWMDMIAYQNSNS